jgi:hypothetical protein
MRQDQYNDLPRSRRTTFGAQSTSPFAAGFNAGGLLFEEGHHGLHYRFQDCVPFLSCSAHSMRVWACVLLDDAGISPDYIKKRLRWMGDFFRMYLRDTHVIQDQHREALWASSEEVMYLVSALPTNILRLSIMSEEIAGDDKDMGVYHDDMD